jgi:hypothetical protein
VGGGCVVNGLSTSDFAAEGASWPADFKLQVTIDFMDQHGEKHADYQGLKDRLEYYVEANDDAWILESFAPQPHQVRATTWQISARRRVGLHLKHHVMRSAHWL